MSERPFMKVIKIKINLDLWYISSIKQTPLIYLHDSFFPQAIQARW